jgi:hypothetical protein
LITNCDDTKFTSQKFNRKNKIFSVVDEELQTLNL